MILPARQSVTRISEETGIHICTLYAWRKGWRLEGEARLIQSVSQALLSGLRAWAEVGGIASFQCPKAFLLPPISI
jgi:hypothetical protein